MLGHLLEVEALFDELADKVAALIKAHASDPDAVARLAVAQQAVKRGAGIVRSQIETQDGHVRG